MGLNAQYQTTTPAFRLTDAPTSGYTLAQTDPSAAGNRPLAAYLQASTQNIRFTIDGSAPTASVGMLLVAGADPFYYAGPLNELRFIQVASGAVLNVVYSPLFATPKQGIDGATGAQGAVGPAGVGVPAGGDTNQVLAKASGADYNTFWDNAVAPPYSTDSPVVIINDAPSSIITNGVRTLVGTDSAGNFLLSVFDAVAYGTGPGTFTPDNSGLFILTPTGDEICRIWAGDPDINNFNSGNLYIGYRAGYAQPSDNVTAGYSNLGVGWSALESLTTGFQNTASGLRAGQALIDGSNNTFFGYDAGRTVDSDAVNRIGLGALTVVTADNRAVIGNDSVVDVYMGSETAEAVVHANGYAVANVPGVDASIVIPTVGTLTITKGIVTGFA